MVLNLETKVEAWAEALVCLIHSTVLGKPLKMFEKRTKGVEAGINKICQTNPRNSKQFVTMEIHFANSTA